MPRKKRLPTGVTDHYATGLHIRWPGPPDPNGKPTTKSKTLKGIWDPNEASAIREKCIGETTALVARGSHSMTVRDLNAAWKARRMKDFEDNTQDGYAWIFPKIEETEVQIIRARKPVVMPLGMVRLIDLGRPTIREWLDYLEEHGRKGGTGPLAGSSIRKVAGLFSEILGWGVDRGWLTANPAHGQRLPEADPKGARALTTRELKRLVAHVKDPVMRAAAFTMWSVGLRPSEVLGLSVPDVLLNDRLLLARRVRTGRGTAKRLKDRDPRALAMPDTLVRLLRRHVAWIKDRAEAFGDGYRWDLMLLFPQPDGSRITVGQLRGAVHAAAYDARLGVVNPKDARTTWATMADEDVVNEDEVEAVSDNLGHASRATTERHYIRPVEAPVRKPKERERKVANRMDQRLRFVLDPALLGPPAGATEQAGESDPAEESDRDDQLPVIGARSGTGRRSRPARLSSGPATAQGLRRTD